jgi:hypothetical protein
MFRQTAIHRSAHFGLFVLSLTLWGAELCFAARPAVEVFWD